MRRFDHIRTYGVVGNREQDSVVEILTRTHERLKTRPMVVEFYGKENWKTWSSPATGNSGGDRGPETPVRTVEIR